MALDNGRVTGQLDTGLPDPQNDPEVIVAKTFNNLPIYLGDTVCELDGDYYFRDDELKFLAAYIRDCGAGAILEELGSTERVMTIDDRDEH